MERLVITTKFLIVALILQSILITCRRKPQRINQDVTFEVDVENCRTKIDLKLSDLIENCRLVPLETTKESILGNSFRYIYVTDEFILIDDNNGIFLFTKDGKFINKIIDIGRGPKELSVSHLLHYYDVRDLLFINDHFNNLNEILCYDVSSQSFQPSIKKCFPGQWDDFIILNDSLIMGSPSLFEADSNPYALFFQDFKGNFLYGIKSKRRLITRNQEEILQRMLFYSGDQKIHIKYTFDDTLFVLDNNMLSPYLVSQYNTPRIELPHLNPEIGEKRNRFENYENPCFLIFNNATFKGNIPFKPGTLKADYKRVYFFMDKSNGNYGIIKSYTDDFIGKNQTSENEIMTFPSSLPNNKLYVFYYPNDILQIASSNQHSKGLPDSLFTQLNTIRTNLTETDNPVLLIGSPRKRM